VYEQLGLHCYAASTHPDELVFEPPPPKKNPESAYECWPKNPRKNEVYCFNIVADDWHSVI